MFVIFLIFPLIGLADVARARTTVYRLGVPEGHTTPLYERLFRTLENKGLIVGENLQIVPINLTDFQTKTGKEKIRREIAEKCDLFFTTGDHLVIILAIKIQSPLLFVGMTGPEHTLPPTMQKNSTGFYRGSRVAILKQSIEMLPEGRRGKLGLIYFRGSSLKAQVPANQKIFKNLGIELVSKEYADKADIERVMQQFKDEGVKGLILYPPGVRKDELPELITWQNRLKLPVIGQTRDSIEKGILGGPTMNLKILMPNIADYVAKILQGRNPSQLPVKYFGPRYVVNLATVSKLGLNIPREVVEQADIVGLAAKAKVQQKKNTPLVPGNFVIGIPQQIPAPLLKSLGRALSEHGYVENKNLHFIRFDLKNSNNEEKQQQLVRKIPSKADLIFVNGSVLPSLIQLLGFKTPVCFISTKEIGDLVPDDRKNQFAGVIRTSFASTVKISQMMMHGAKRMGILAHSHSNILHIIDQLRKIADDYGVTIELARFSSASDIGAAMEGLRKRSDFVLLFPPATTPEDIDEIVYQQNQLRLPVLSHFKKHVEAGFFGGPMMDMNKVTNKLAEYIDKLLQGRSPCSLPIYYYQDKIIINLRTASILQQDIPADITAQAEIVK